MPKIGPWWRKKPLISWEKTGVDALNNYMVLNTPCVKAATLADTTEAAVCPAANMPAALTVLDTRVAGRHAEVVAEGHAVATRTAAGPRPRRTSRTRNIDRARSNRSFRVVFATPSC